MIQYPKKTSYTLDGREEPHIFRDPPKSIHTRRRDNVEIGDIMYQIEEDNSRINEGVNEFARGVNPMVAVSYSNHGNGATTTSLNQNQASNPYKVAKDGAFRPPMYMIEDLLPLSRMRRDRYSVTSNPSKNELTTNNPSITANHIDRRQINKSLHPTAVFRKDVRINNGDNIKVKSFTPLPFTTSVGSSNTINDITRDNVVKPNGVFIRPLVSWTSPLEYPYLVEQRNNNVNNNNISNRPITSGHTSVQNIYRDISRGDNTNDLMILNRPLFSVTSSTTSPFLLSPELNGSERMDAKLRENGKFSVTSSSSLPVFMRQDENNNFSLKDNTLISQTSIPGMRIIDERKEVVPLERKLPNFNVTARMGGDALRYDSSYFTPKDSYLTDKPLISAVSSTSRIKPLEREETRVMKTKEVQRRGYNNAGFIPTCDREVCSVGSNMKVDSVKEKAAREIHGRWGK